MCKNISCGRRSKYELAACQESLQDEHLLDLGHDCALI